MNKKIFTRNIGTEKIYLRTEENGDRFIDGYAILFNQRSKLIRDWDGEYYEIIAKGAADRVLQDPDLNVIATVDHWRDKMLGRTKSGTLQLKIDDKGLMYSVKVPSTTLGNDIAEMIARGDYFESSFIFTVNKMQWDKTQDPNVRTILEIEKLFDVSIVIDGAYANTAVKLRSQEWEQEDDYDVQPKNNRSDILLLKRQLEIHKLKL